MPNLLYRDLGSISYAQALDLQTSLFRELIQTKTENRNVPEPERRPVVHHVLVCEHNPPVYTLGRNGKPEHLLLPEEVLQAQGVEFFRTGRGGDITFHGPGQLVAYPIVDLDDFRPDVGLYVRTLEESVLRLLSHYGLQGERLPGASGVWLDAHTPRARKICALGIHLSRWVAMHGLALNVSTDLRFFENIIPCGIDDKGVTSMERELGKVPDMTEVKRLWFECFSQAMHQMLAPKL